MIGCVLFDLDETLHDRTRSLKDFLVDQFARHARLHAVNCQAFVDEFLMLDQRGRASKTVVYPQLLTAFGIVGGQRESEAFAASLFKEFDESSHRFTRGFPGLDALLTDLRQRKIRTGIVTNGRTAHQTLKLEALDLPRRVDTILISEAEDVRKPDREIFDRAAGRLNVMPGTCVFIGDSPEQDITGAANAGMHPVWFPNGATWPAELPRVDCPQIGQLNEVLPLIDRLSATN